MPPLFLPLVLLALTALAPPPAPIAQPPAPPVVAVPLGDLAQEAARVAVRTSGLSANDAEVDALASRARWSALLPEVRLEIKDSSAGMHDYVSSTGSLTSSYFGASYEVDGTLVFHFERLAYSGQESRLERLRLERIRARARVVQRVIDEVARWSKATGDERQTPDGTDAHADAIARRVSAQMALDVWTGGWFSRRLAGRAP